MTSVARDRRSAAPAGRSSPAPTSRRSRRRPGATRPRRPTGTICCAASRTAAKPVVMAIHGTALGGGLELAMAGHYRVAVASAQVGQPEVNLGIIPGAEGTQRLPRLAGVAKALDMCVTGRPISAADALAAGIVDEIAGDDLTASAVAFARRVAARRPAREDARARAIGSATPATNAPLFAAAASSSPARSGAVRPRRSRPSTRSRPPTTPAVRRGLPARARAVPRVRARRAGQGADSRVLRRARGGEAARGRARGADATPSSAPSPSSARARWDAGIAMACANAGLDVHADRCVRRGARRRRCARSGRTTTARSRAAA